MAERISPHDFRNNSRAPPAWKMKHYSNQNEHPVMLTFDTIALGLSASMTLIACATVFKWKSVRSNASHGTLFMVFLSLGLWSLAKLVHIVISEILSPRDRWVGRRFIMYSTVITDILFNATSLWCIFATYEFQRWIARPRIHSHRVMLWYNVLVLALCLGPFVSVLIVDIENPPPERIGWRRNMTEGARQAYFMNRTNFENKTNWKYKVPVTLDLVETIFWVSYGVRWLAVIYPIVLGTWFALKKRKQVENWTSIQSFVLLLVLLNLPYLVLEPLFDFEYIDKTDFLLLFSFAKCATYFSGVGMVNILGLYLGVFDVHYTPKEKNQLSMNSGFVVFDSGRSVSLLRLHSNASSEQRSRLQYNESS